MNQQKEPIRILKDIPKGFQDFVNLELIDVLIDDALPSDPAKKRPIKVHLIFKDELGNYFRAVDTIWERGGSITLKKLNEYRKWQNEDKGSVFAISNGYTKEDAFVPKEFRPKQRIKPGSKKDSNKQNSDPQPITPEMVIVLDRAEVHFIHKKGDEKLPPQQRIEFLKRSTMNKLSGLDSPEQIINEAIARNNSSVAIIDENGIQAIPEIQIKLEKLEQEVKKELTELKQQFPNANDKELYDKLSPKTKLKNDFKVIFGATMDVVDDENTNLIIGNYQKNKTPLKDLEFVAYDIETTGLSANYDEIIEIGAVKIKDGKIVDRFQTFVKPSQPIPTKIKKITNIKDSDVANAPTIQSALNSFKKFVGDNVLIAHNGNKFDMRFINNKCVENKIKPFDNVAIDTMNVSKAFNDKNKDNLKSFCSMCSTSYDDKVAHRADYDAEVLANAWMNFTKLPSVKTYQNYENFKEIQEQENFTTNENLTLNELQTIGINKPKFWKQQKFNSSSTFYINKQKQVPIMNELISKELTNFQTDTPSIKKNELLKYCDKNNLILTNGVKWEDEIYDSANNETFDKLISKIKKYSFISIVPPENFSHLITTETITKKQIEDVTANIVLAAKQAKVPVVVVTESCYINKRSSKAFNVLSSMKLDGRTNKYFKSEKIPDSVDPSKEIVKIFDTPELSWKTDEEIKKSFAFLQKLKPNKLNDKEIENILFNNSKSLSSQYFKEKIMPMKRGQFFPKIDNADKLMKDMCYKNAEAKYGKKLPEQVKARLDREIEAITKSGYASLYWYAHLLVKEINDMGWIVGSRGSVGSSLVATMLNITEVNPLPAHYVCPKCKSSIFVNDTGDGFDLPQKTCACGQIMNGEGHNIPFETFLGFEGDKVPDIDLNFAGEVQGIAHNFIKEMFGEKQAFRAGTISTTAEKTTENATEDFFESQKLDVSPYQIKDIAANIPEVKRTTGQHAGGIIVVPKGYNIYDFTPINYPADDKESSWYTTHYAFEYLHDNLLKFDILGHDDPSILKNLQIKTGVNPTTINLNNEKEHKEVLKMFTSDKAFGLPEFGTDFARRALDEAKPKNINELIKLSGLLHGTNVWDGNIRELVVKKGIKLNDVPCCRDDIMQFLISKGMDKKLSFDIMERVRKGKHLTNDDIKALSSHNVSDDYIEACNKIEYMFPKAHATAYVINAYRVAWFKKYHPAAFYSAWLETKSTGFDVQKLLQGYDVVEDYVKKYSLFQAKMSLTKTEQDKLPTYKILLDAKQNGVKVGKLSLNNSDGSKWLIEKDNKTIIPPLSVLDGLGESVANKIQEVLKNRRKINPSAAYFKTIDDLKTSVKELGGNVTIAALQALYEANAFSPYMKLDFELYKIQESFTKGSKTVKKLETDEQKQQALSEMEELIKSNKTIANKLDSIPGYLEFIKKQREKLAKPKAKGVSK